MRNQLSSLAAAARRRHTKIWSGVRGGWFACCVVGIKLLASGQFLSSSFAVVASLQPDARLTVIGRYWLVVVTTGQGWCARLVGRAGVATRQAGHTRPA